MGEDIDSHFGKMSEIIIGYLFLLFRIHIGIHFFKLEFRMTIFYALFKDEMSGHNLTWNDKKVVW